MNIIEVTEVTITGPIKNKGSNAVEYNVDKNGVPFGKVWTFKARGEVHPFHAKTLAGAYANFPTYDEAETFMRGEM